MTAHQNKSSKVTVNTEQWTLYHLAKSNEFDPYENGRRWDINRTMERLENIVDYTIVFSAIVGTVLWAFG